MMRKPWGGRSAAILLGVLISLGGMSADDSTPEPVRVRQVDVETQGEGVTITLRASGPLGYETLTLTQPTRLVVDLPQSILLARQRHFAVDAHGVVGVRLAQFTNQPPVTRLVVDLRELLPYEINSTPDGLRLSLIVPAGPAFEPARPAVSAPAPAAAERVERAAPPAHEAETEPGPTLVASLAPTVPLGRQATPAPAVEPPAETLAPAGAPPAPMAANTTPVAPQLPGGAAPAASAPAQAAAGPAAPVFTGEPISVNLKDVDLKDFFRLIHEISGLNIVVDPNVSGSVTLVLIDVPWDQALDIVLRNSGLSSTLEGNVLRIATRATLKKEQEETRDLAQARAEAVDPVMVTRQLSYAKATDLEPTLKRFLSGRGEIIRDDRTNTLIIRDIPAVIPGIDDLIKQLDRKTLQVEIEARVVSANRNFAREIGTEFGLSFFAMGARAGAGHGFSIIGGDLRPGGLTSDSRGIFPPLIASGTTSEQPLISDLRAAATSALRFGHRSTNFGLDFILTAAETRGIAKVLSRPRLVTQNNIQAEVKQGTRIPVQTVVNNTISTQFVDATLKLNVKPQVTAEGTVFLDITIENTTPDFGRAVNNIPSMNTQATTTQVLISDGGTVVIGGVMITDNSTDIDQVPFLGSIPLIGHLFRRTSVSTSTQELLFFITPRILQT